MPHNADSRLLANNRRTACLGISLFILSLGWAERGLCANCQRRTLLELTSDGTVFYVRSVNDFKQALFLGTVTSVFLLQDVWVTEEQWKDFVVPEIDREVVVEPHESLLKDGIVPQIFTDGLLKRIKVVENGRLIFRDIQALDIGEPRVVDGYTRLVPFFDISPGQGVEFHNTTWNVEPFCSTLGGLAGVRFATMLRCTIPECNMIVLDEKNSVFVERGRWDNAGAESPQGYFDVYNTTWDCGNLEPRKWIAQAIPDSMHTVSTMAELVSTAASAEPHSYTSLNLQNDVTFFSSFFPENGLHVSQRRLRVDGVEGRRITLQDGMVPVFHVTQLGHLEIANIDFSMNACDLREWRSFVEFGDTRDPTVEGAYGSEWEYIVPSVIVDAVPAPQTKTTLQNITFSCYQCSPISFTQYGAALIQANISRFQDDVPDEGNMTLAESSSFPFRYTTDTENLIVRSGNVSLHFQDVVLDSYYEVYHSSAVLELENVTLTCGSFVSLE
ncbi:hypothetical protein BSKO_06022 [Bryopsis sp. KO-2023]|nr:hypothetical protein BSKO_06022 [Bryopsis sp. KO-2023]